MLNSHYYFSVSTCSIYPKCKVLRLCVCLEIVTDTLYSEGQHIGIDAHEITKRNVVNIVC